MAAGGLASIIRADRIIVPMIIMMMAIDRIISPTKSIK